MRIKIVLLAMAVFAANASNAFPGFKLPATKSVNIRKTQSFDFVFFRTHQQCGSVKIAWALNSTNGVFCFTLQRTYQNPTSPDAVWEDIESFLPGDDPVIRYTDRNVAHGYVSYRVVAFVFDGSCVVSEVERERIGGWSWGWWHH